jgi:penicillin-binding protein 1B
MQGFIDRSESSQGDKMPDETKWENRRIWLVALSISALAAFVIYIVVLYQQLHTNFNQISEFVPTRLYADVTKIAAGQPRGYIENRLKNLGYNLKFMPQQSAIEFELHPIDYPKYLLPAEYQSPDPSHSTVLLKFDGNDSDSLLATIENSQIEVNHVYLEPELIATLSHAKDKAIREHVDFANIPATVWKSIIAIEDQHFLDHNGLDPRGILRAIWVNVTSLSLKQGGSTITQQLVKNLMVRRSKNIFKKINELFLSILLETQFEKEKILERYLNEVYLGQVGNMEVHGVSEGAKYFFSKRVDDLNLAEIALMAGLIRGPAFYSPYKHFQRAMERKQLVLKKMVETGLIAEAEAQNAEKLPIRLAPPQSISNKAPFFTDYVKAELIQHLKDRYAEDEIASAGLKVYTTLDLYLNQSAQTAVANGTSKLEKDLNIESPDRLEGALASVDHSNGYIKALIGGRNYSQSNFNRILNMKRQVGSTFKPLVYLTALRLENDRKGIPYGPGHPAEDSPWTLVFDRGKQKWSPKNYDKEFKGWITYRKALAGSINTVTAKVGIDVGIQNIISVSRELGISSELPAVPSLALGVAELSPVELLKVYATIANHGVQDTLTVIRGITLNDGTGLARFVYHPKILLDPAKADTITYMLQSVFTEGTAIAASRLGFNRPAAGKTGTTSNHRDSWFAGYTPQLTTVVWVGMDQSGPETENPADAFGQKDKKKKKKLMLTGASSALPIWVDFMNQALAHEDPAQFNLNEEMVDVAIDTHTGLRARSDCPSDQVLVEKYPKSIVPRNESCDLALPPSQSEAVVE